MKLFHFFFNFLEPENSKHTSFLSRSFSSWKTKKQNKKNEIYKQNATNSLFFEVDGAGEIEIGKSCFAHTGKSFGFRFGVSWGRHGFCGGVLDRENAKRLAEFILLECNKVTIERKNEEQKYLKEREEILRENFDDVI